MKFDRRFATALAAAPPASFLALMWIYGSDAIFADEWYILTLLVKAKEGASLLGDYLEFHSVHRMVPAKFLLTRLGLLTGWNVRVELLINATIACFSYVAILIIARRTAPHAWIGAVGAAALSIFSFSQYENWFWGWQLSWFLAIALTLAALVALTSHGIELPLRLAWAIALCFTATFSIGFGLVSWIALAPVVWIESDRRLRPLVVWAFAALTTFALYFAGQGFSIERASGRSIEFADYGVFFAALTGAPLAGSALPAILLGVVVLVLFAASAVAALRSDSRAAMPWLSVGIFSLGFAAMATVTRARLGFEGALSSRYTTPMILLISATFFLATISERRDGRFRRLASVVLIALALADAAAFSAFTARASSLYAKRICLDLAFLLEDVECHTTRNPLATVERMARLRAYELRRFADVSWFEPPSDRRIEAKRAGSSVLLAGQVGRSLLPRFVLITVGDERRAVGLVRAGTDGTFRASVDARNLSASSNLEVWTIRNHARRFTHVGTASIASPGDVQGIKTTSMLERTQLRSP